MKRILLFAALLPLFVLGQEYKTSHDIKYLRDTLLINGFKIKKGDTLRLGAGTKTNGDFAFVYNKPTLGNGVNDGPLPSKYALAYLILSEMKELSFGGNSFLLPVFYVNGNKRMKVQVNFTNAIKYNEILLPPTVDTK